MPPVLIVGEGLVLAVGVAAPFAFGVALLLFGLFSQARKPTAQSSSNPKKILFILGLLS
jgi:hypothetical protein